MSVAKAGPVRDCKRVALIGLRSDAQNTVTSHSIIYHLRKAGSVISRSRTFPNLPRSPHFVSVTISSPQLLLHSVFPRKLTGIDKSKQEWSQNLLFSLNLY